MEYENAIRVHRKAKGEKINTQWAWPKSVKTQKKIGGL